jgi:hypothetical protein
MSYSSAFTVLEAFCETSKGSPDKNEDRLVMTDDFVAVIDGATASGSIDGIPGGIVAAEAIAGVIRSMQSEISARAFVDQASAALDARLGGRIAHGQMRPSAAVVVWSRFRNEIWRVGDCHFRIDENIFSGEKEIDRIAYSFRCAVIQARLALGLTSIEEERAIPTMQQPFAPLVTIQHAFMNVESDDPLCYGAIDGRFVPDHLIEIHSSEGSRDIILCSDGFFSPPATLSAGLASLAALKVNDPLIIATGQGSRPFAIDCDLFDDTTYVRVGIQQRA